MSLFYRICGRLVDKSVPPAVPTTLKIFATYPKEGSEYLHRPDAALDSFKKADVQDAGRCLACQKKMMIKYGMELWDWKTAETGAGEFGVSDASHLHHRRGWRATGRAHGRPVDRGHAEKVW